MLLAKGIDCDKIVRGVQPICFDNAVWAYTLGTAIAVKRGLTDAAECAAAIGEGLEAFTIPGSVAEAASGRSGSTGSLGARLLKRGHHLLRFPGSPRVLCCCWGAIGIARTANKGPADPRVILNGQARTQLTSFPYQRLHLCADRVRYPHPDPDCGQEIPLLRGVGAPAVKCYGANDVMEGVAIA